MIFAFLSNSDLDVRMAGADALSKLSYLTTPALVRNSYEKKTTHWHVITLRQWLFLSDYGGGIPINIIQYRKALAPCE